MCRKVLLLTCFAAVLSMVCADAAFAIVWEARVRGSSDDREHYVGGSIDSAGSSDLEMPYEDEGKGSPQTVGIRFLDVEIPKGANITAAYVEFVCDETKGGSLRVSLVIDGHLDPNPPTFTTDIIGRPRTAAKAIWEPEEWTSSGQVSQTSDISAVISELVNQDGWVNGNAIALIISDNPDNPSQGIRCAEAVDGSAMQAPLLHIEFSSKYASNPAPANGELYADTWVSLGWDPGETAVTHDVYMSDNFDLVNDRDPAAFQGNQAFPFFTAGFPGFAYPDGLVPGTTYYWAIDEVEADGTTKYNGDVWSFSIPSKAAYDPSPRDGGKAVDTDVTLSWTPGFGAKLHTVYFGDDLDTVSNATGGAPSGTATFSPGTLEKDKVYYWRVDEFNPPETIKGDVWTFRTMPEIVITDPDLIGWWKFDNVVGNTVRDWSGYGNDGQTGGDPQQVEGAIDFGLDLDGDDYVSVDAVADDLTSKNYTLSAWIKTTQFGEGNVFASNTGGSHVLLFGVDNGNIYVDDGPSTDWPPAVNDDKWHMISLV
ncbi:MAG: LamG-like jellyroll fold domain-containing protein, partial [Planctomycetota bacterium]